VNRFRPGAFRGLPTDLKLYLITLFYMGFAVGYLAGGGPTPISTAILIVGVLFILLSARWGKRGR